jgi:hypothetical protein
VRQGGLLAVESAYKGGSGHLANDGAGSNATDVRSVRNAVYEAAQRLYVEFVQPFTPEQLEAHERSMEGVAQGSRANERCLAF